jgi:hypothetical protein
MVIKWVERRLAAICALSLFSVLLNCSKAPPDPSGKDLFVSRAVRQQQGPVTVQTSVLSDDESQSYFGAGLADQGIQAIWLSVENGSDATLYYLPVTTDPNYFSPPEAAQLLHVWWSSKANAAIDTVLARDAMPDIILPHQTAGGFVLTHREGGLKFLNASFVESRQQFDFRFVLPLGGRTYAVQKVDFSVYTRQERSRRLISRGFAHGWRHYPVARSTRRTADRVIRSISLSSAAAQTQFFRSSRGDGG